jgi:hypothetical protein
MNAVVQNLATQALLLSPEEQVELANLLMAKAVDYSPASAEIDEAWEAEIRSRVEEMDNGTATYVSSAEVELQVQKILRAGV